VLTLTTDPFLHSQLHVREKWINVSEILNDRNKPGNEGDRDLNHHSFTSCYRKGLIQLPLQNYMYWRRGSKR